MVVTGASPPATLVAMALTTTVTATVMETDLTGLTMSTARGLNAVKFGVGAMTARW